MKEIFFKNQRFFHVFSQKHQGRQGKGDDPQEQGGQKSRKQAAWTPESQKIEHRPQHQDERHEQPQAAVSHGVAHEEEHQGGQEAEQQVRQQPGPIQSQPLPQGGGKVVYQSQQGTAGQGTQGLQPLPSGVQAHQPRSLPNQLRRPGAFSA